MLLASVARAMPRRTAPGGLKMNVTSALRVLHMFVSVFLFFLRSLLPKTSDRKGRGKGKGPGGGPGSGGAGGGGGGPGSDGDLGAVLSTLSSFGLLELGRYQ